MARDAERELTGTITGFLVAVGATSAVCYALTTRRQNHRIAGGPRRGGFDGDGGSSTDDGGYMPAGGLVTHHSALDGCGNPIDARQLRQCKRRVIAGAASDRRRLFAKLRRRYLICRNNRCLDRF
jgi:hypothetical protein